MLKKRFFLHKNPINQITFSFAHFLVKKLIRSISSSIPSSKTLQIPLKVGPKSENFEFLEVASFRTENFDQKFELQ